MEALSLALLWCHLISGPIGMKLGEHVTGKSNPWANSKGESNNAKNVNQRQTKLTQLNKINTNSREESSKNLSSIRNSGVITTNNDGNNNNIIRERERGGMILNKKGERERKREDGFSFFLLEKGSVPSRNKWMSQDQGGFGWTRIWLNSFEHRSHRHNRLLINSSLFLLFSLFVSVRLSICLSSQAKRMGWRGSTTHRLQDYDSKDGGKSCWTLF